MCSSFILLTKHLRAEIPPRWPRGVHLLQFDGAVHAAEVHWLLCDAYRDGGGRVEVLDEWWSALRSDGEYDPALVILAADPADRIIGVALCWTSAFVKDLAVTASWRGKGVGTALLQHAFETLRKRGALRVDLKVERDNPHGAERLYRALGMVPAAAKD